jgi:hypothetical protein
LGLTAGCYAKKGVEENNACYWKNGVKTVLPGGRTGGNIYAQANAVTVSGSSVCVAGYESNAAHIAMATYWRNGFQNLLTGGKTYAYAYGIAFGGAK